MGALLLRLKTWWEMADRTQRTVTLVGLGFLAVLLFGTFTFAAKPRMGLLYGSLNEAEQGMVVTEVQSLGIPVEMDERGNVMIPTNRIAEVRAKLAMQGKTPRTAHLGDEDLGKMSMGTTPPVERERLKAVLEGKLAQSIEVMDGVQAARVHITLEDSSPFVRESKPAKATVTIIERPGASFNSEKGRAIALMVTNAVQGLDLSNVMIVNQFSEPVYDPMASEGQGGVISAKLETEQAEAQRRRMQLQADLDRAFGPGATIAQISNLEIDFDDRQFEETTNTPSEAPVASQTVKEEMSGGSRGVGGVAGAAANIAPGQPGTAGAGGPGEYTSNQKTEQYLHNTKTERVKRAAGTVVSMSVNVLVDSNKVEDVAAVDKVIAGFLGAKASDESFTKAVTAVPFDKSAAEEAKKAAAAAASREKMQQMISLLPIAALVLVGVFVMKAIGKASKGISLSGGGASLPAAAAADSLAKALNNVASAVGGPAPSKAAVQALAMATSDEEMTPEIKAIRDKLNIPLEQIKKMAEQRPETVAMLIKSWLVEEGIRR